MTQGYLRMLPTLFLLASLLRSERLHWIGFFALVLIFSGFLFAAAARGLGIAGGSVFMLGLDRLYSYFGTVLAFVVLLVLCGALAGVLIPSSLLPTRIAQDAVGYVLFTALSSPLVVRCWPALALPYVVSEHAGYRLRRPDIRHDLWEGPGLGEARRLTRPIAASVRLGLPAIVALYVLVFGYIGVGEISPRSEARPWLKAAMVLVVGPAFVLLATDRTRRLLNRPGALEKARIKE